MSRGTPWLIDSRGKNLEHGHSYLFRAGRLYPCDTKRSDEQAAAMAEKYPAYWKPLPQHWQAIDTYRIDDLFPLASSRLYHARKKLLVPGCRTGGKSVYDDIKEAHATLGAWLADNKPEQS